MTKTTIISALTFVWLAAAPHVFAVSTMVPDVSDVCYNALRLPAVGSNTLHIITPTLLELKLIDTKAADPARVTQWDLVNSSGQFMAPPLSSFTTTVNGQPVTVTAVGFKRRPLYAPFASNDLRIDNSLYLLLANPVPEGQPVEVTNPSGSLWNSAMKFIAVANPMRHSPAIHVNQEGYMPGYSKKGMIGYYAGSLGEVPIPISGGFKVIEAKSGTQVFQGALVQRPDVGYTYVPTPYQKVYEADFSSFDVPGEYRLMVPGLGASMPFRIDEGISMAFARAYALGLYHQRCGTNTAMPHTRFIHDICHAAPAAVPSPATSFPFTWNTVAGYANTINANNPAQTAPRLTSPSAQLFPFIRSGAVDVSGGHHDAGDYSKYTINSASLIHYLMFAVDSLAGVGALDNLGIPESGDGISDILQEAKWEADFLAKMQDTDGGFYFLVYPKDREYENNVAPDRGDAQVVWPKTTSVTAAAVAALAQCASSPRFKQAYPEIAARYLEKAKLGWRFLLDAVQRYGKDGGYQKITHYGDDFTDRDELAWAAAEIYLATGDLEAHQKLLSWFNPADPATWRWGWWHMSQCWGNAIRSYAFAVRSGRLGSNTQLDANFLAKSESEIVAAGDDTLKWAKQSAYGTSFPEATKRVKAAGWYFSTDQAFDVAVAYQINPKVDYVDALISNMNYEGGCNPVDVSYVTGLGWKRQRDVVNQWAVNDRQTLPPSGQPVGNVTANFGYLWYYGGMLNSLPFPSDGAATAPYPFYDRWGDSWNVNAEFVVLNSARSLAALSFLAARTPLKNQTWNSAVASIQVPSSVVPVGQPLTLELQVVGMDLGAARVVWEARDQEPSFGQSFTILPKNNGLQWVEAEAQWPDGRRAFARAVFEANSPDTVWVYESLPTGATASSEGGDSWNWTLNTPPPDATKAHASSSAITLQQHFFDNATATMAVGPGDVLYAWVYLPSTNMPREVMLQWTDGSWEHRAYWGENLIGYGQNGTSSRRNMGALPAPGQWVQLKVPASLVDLENKTVKGMAFSLYGGTAIWGRAGRLSQASIPTLPVNATIRLTSEGAVLLWNSTANTRYRVYSNSVPTDQNWSLAAEVTTPGSTNSWLDRSAFTDRQRFYKILPVN